MVHSTERLLDAYLVAAARTGSRSAMERLARRWHPKLLGHAMRLTGEAELARDAVQIAWTEILRGLAKLKEEQAFPAWAFRIVSRACAGEIGRKVSRRKLKQAFRQEPREAEIAPIEPGDGDALRTAIRQLPAGERAAIALYHFEELRVAEVAVALNIPAGTVKTRLMNARKKLRRILTDELEGET